MNNKNFTDKLYDLIVDMYDDNDDIELTIDDDFFESIPNNVKYSRVEEYINNNKEKFKNVDITRRMFTSYIKAGILPEIDEKNKPNNNLNYYTKDQILYYIMAQQLKDLTQLDNISYLFKEIRNNKELGYDSKDIFEIYFESYEMGKNQINTVYKDLLSKISGDYDVENKTEAFEEGVMHLGQLVILAISRAFIDNFNSIYKKNNLKEDK